MCLFVSFYFYSILYGHFPFDSLVHGDYSVYCTLLFSTFYSSPQALYT